MLNIVIIILHCLDVIANDNVNVVIIILHCLDIIANDNVNITTMHYSSHIISCNILFKL